MLRVPGSPECSTGASVSAPKHQKRETSCAGERLRAGSAMRIWGGERRTGVVSETVTVRSGGPRYKLVSGGVFPARWQKKPGPTERTQASSDNDGYMATVDSASYTHTATRPG